MPGCSHCCRRGWLLDSGMYYLAAVLGVAILQGTARTNEPFDRSVSTNDEPSLVVLCDPQAFRFSIRATADASTLDRTYPRRTVIDPETLTQMLPGSTGLGEIRGPLIRYVRCGPYTVKLEGDAYNSNVQGEAGAYGGFAAVSVIVGNQTIFGAVRLTECDRLLPRARPCPEGYAVRIDGIYDAAKHKLKLIKTVSSTDDGDEATRQITTATTMSDLDLSTWLSVYDK